MRLIVLKKLAWRRSGYNEHGALDRAGFITGTVIPVDGGILTT
jgi:hypothetical protein